MEISLILQRSDPQTTVLFVGLPIILPNATEGVILGSAILGACASRDFSSIQVCNFIWPHTSILYTEPKWNHGLEH